MTTCRPSHGTEEVYRPLRTLPVRSSLFPQARIRSLPLHPFRARHDLVRRDRERFSVRLKMSHRIVKPLRRGRTGVRIGKPCVYPLRDGVWSEVFLKQLRHGRFESAFLRHYVREPDVPHAFYDASREPCQHRPYGIYEHRRATHERGLQRCGPARDGRAIRNAQEIARPPLLDFDGRQPFEVFRYAADFPLRRVVRRRNADAKPPVGPFARNRLQRLEKPRQYPLYLADARSRKEREGLPVAS